MSATSTDLATDPWPAARPDRSGLAPLAALVAAQLAAGVVIGLIWLQWSPSAVSYLLSDGSGGSLVIPDESEAQIADDGRFVVLSVLAGVLFGLLAWILRRVRGPIAIAVLAAGGLLSSVLARTTGQLLSGGTDSAALNTAFHPKLTLHASAALWLQALVAVLVYTALAGLATDPTLGRPVTDPLAGHPNAGHPSAGHPVPPIAGHPAQPVAAQPIARHPVPPIAEPDQADRPV